MMQWYNEPPQWHQDNDVIHMTAGAKTDFWRHTHYGFVRDNGNFYYQNVSGDFTAEVKITGDYRSLYDQAGIMVRESETIWLKCGIEFVETVQNVSAVVTRDYSDWSVVPLDVMPISLWLRVKRRAETVEVQYSLEGKNYSMLRLAYLTESPLVQVGLMCAAPEGEGFAVQFEGFRLF